MKKEITSTIYVSINGEYRLWDSLSMEEKKDISINLNDRAMQAIGYQRKDKTA
ncbi:hypothetical protein I5677_12325 [Mobilitalea sibirica]|uniref:Uncharacterized protein n=1 Tax=Mobilitalea sibirica TaxID=1462919 RepID=A0A8J7KWR7_9FIRM|nr:hypothetical protein [Mobilitalea sibirica]MBH1941680.1 hypothetical protein [Mobilitalea sibirica]